MPVATRTEAIERTPMCRFKTRSIASLGFHTRMQLAQPRGLFGELRACRLFPPQYHPDLTLLGFRVFHPPTPYLGGELWFYQSFLNVLGLLDL